MISDADPSAPNAGGSEALQELAGTGALRVGIVAAPAMSALFAIAVGETFRGVTIDIAKALAADLGVSSTLVNFPNSGACTDALEAGAIDVSFMPVDEERRRRVAFGPAYYILESTYMVTAASGIATLGDVDRPGVRVVGIANTTTIRAATRSLSHVVPEAVSSIAEGVERLRAETADAFALSRDAFRTLLPTLPGALVLDGGFQSTGIAIAVGKHKPAALDFVSRFLEEAKRSGLVRRALDAAGFPDEAVAPPQD
jgi:polar amino acid transport system substrate-binding protein